MVKVKGKKSYSQLQLEYHAPTFPYFLCSSMSSASFCVLSEFRTRKCCYQYELFSAVAFLRAETTFFMPIVIRAYAAIDGNIGSLFNVGDLCPLFFPSSSPALTLPSSSEKPLFSLKSARQRSCAPPYSQCFTVLAIIQAGEMISFYKNESNKYLPLSTQI